MTNQNGPLSPAMAMLLMAAEKRNLSAVAKAASSAFGILDSGMQNLFRMLNQLWQDLSKVAINSDVSAMRIRMLSKILIDKGMLTEEELVKYTETEVTEPLKKMQQDAEEEMKKLAEEEAAKTEEPPPAPEPPPVNMIKEGSTEPEPASDVVLASERNNVIQFPSKTEE